ncbi:MAG: type VI secretion system tip protein VgrG [Xanthomonadales bacterium]|nr:type VI secretion system tip protein VgrG [Xanthomonadales bacterium]
MGTPTQDKRAVKLHTPLGKDKLFISNLWVKEGVSQLYTINATAFSEDGDIKLEDLLGKTATVEIEVHEGIRYFHGYVARFSFSEYQDTWAVYQLEIKPWTWFLNRTSDCRIFQEKKVPDIFKELSAEYGFTDVEDRLTGTYRTWEYCVQYRETAFNFLSRLLEQEGIYYYFKHEAGKHTLVLADDYSAHEPFPNYASLKYYPPHHDDLRERDHIQAIRATKSVRSGKYVHDDYDLEAPKKNLEAKSQITRPHVMSSFEQRDYPGEYTENGDGDNYAKIRMQEEAASYDVVQGTGDARGLAPGFLFSLQQHDRSMENREYLVLYAEQEYRIDSYISSDASSAAHTFQCRFQAVPSAERYRPPRLTARPFVQGPQTAVVVGPSGEEIWPDKYGRVKVQFHWDRLGRKDENSSCWIRVAQMWAGKKWGAQFIPRCGHEVVVSFLEGDPDQPLITGSVYNGDNMPTYELPGNKTQSGIKTRSSKGGGTDNFNEIRFEDKIGSEQLYVHAEKDMDTVVENNQTLDVGNNRSKTIGNNEDNSIGNDQTSTIANNRKVTIDRGDDTLDLKLGSRTVTVMKNHKVEATMNIEQKAAMQIELTANMSITLTCGASKIEMNPGMIRMSAPMIMQN